MKEFQIRYCLKIITLEEINPYEKDHEGTIQLDNVSDLIEKFDKRE